MGISEEKDPREAQDTTSESTEDSSIVKPVKQKHKAKRSETKQLDLKGLENREDFSQKEKEAERKQIELLDEAEKVLIEAASIAQEKGTIKSKSEAEPSNGTATEKKLEKQGRLPTFLEKTKAGEDLAEKAANEKANAEKEAAEKAANEKAAAEKAASEMAAAEKAASEKAAAERAAAEK